MCDWSGITHGYVIIVWLLLLLGRSPLSANLLRETLQAVHALRTKLAQDVWYQLCEVLLLPMTVDSIRVAVDRSVDCGAYRPKQSISSSSFAADRNGRWNS